MLKAIRRRTTYANVAATLALLFAMSGGAYAASRVLITSTKQIKPSVLAQLKGKTGATGHVGAQGSAGPQGLQGPQGPQGPQGSSGSSGTAGTSVISSTEAPGAHCQSGGSKFTAGSSITYACNGENGTTGFTSALPSGKTETGTWSIQSSGEQVTAESHQLIPISFPIPLEEPIVSKPEPEQEHVFFIGEAEAGEVHAVECPGSVTHPLAAKGDLCVYTTLLQPGITPVSIFDPSLGQASEGAAPSGAMLAFEVTAEARTGFGTWAVTAP